MNVKKMARLLFTKLKVQKLGNPGIWTYMVYKCAAGEEEVVTNLNINTLDPVLLLRKLASV